ncbi:MAG TPA: hypothetical protein VF526_19940 [Solirubrobacteraceae bacterium]|jgi:hypothetical protein
MKVGPTSRLSRPDERIVGLVTLRLLDSWRVWVKRRVEDIKFPDVATQARSISVDFELPLAVVDVVTRARSHAKPPAEPDPGDVADVWTGDAPYVLTPLTVMRKQGLTRFSLRDEGGAALPLLTRDQTGAVAMAVLVTFAEGLDPEPGDGLPESLRAEFADIATMPPNEALKVWEALDKPKGDKSRRSLDIRAVLAGNEEFMAMALDLAQNFLLLTRIAAEPGRRRIIKISYEHTVVPTTPKSKFTARLRRFRRSIGWGAHTEQIETPAVGLGRCFHLEVEAPDGTQVTRARLRTEPRAHPTQALRSNRPYPNFPEVVSDGRQRVHLHVSVPSFYTGYANVFMRPRASTIVRAATVTAGITTVLLTIVALEPRAFQTNLGAAAALLLLVPGGLTGYIVRPQEPHVATQMLLGLRFLAAACGLWAFLAAGALVVGRTCRNLSSCDTESWTAYVIGGLAVCAYLTAITLAITLRNTEHPPEQGPVPLLPGRIIAVLTGLVLGTLTGLADVLVIGLLAVLAAGITTVVAARIRARRADASQQADYARGERQTAWLVGLILCAAAIAGLVVEPVRKLVE